MDDSWHLYTTKEQALHAQKAMAEKVICEDRIPKCIKNIGGVDISNTPFDPHQMLYGALVVCSYPSLSIVQITTQASQQTMPYIRGLLGFREVPILLQLYQRLAVFPDIFMVDGHGTSHPRRLGIASHLGVLLDVPTIGVAKSILVGSPAKDLGEEIGSTTPLFWQGKMIATMLRSKKNASPLIISSGHKISLETATQIVLACLKKHRLPEPTRYAHIEANKCRKSALNNNRALN